MLAQHAPATGGRVLPFDEDAPLKPAAKGKIRGDGRRLHARYRADALLNLSIKLQPPGLVVPLSADIDRHDKHLLSLKAGVYSLRVSEAS